jgi:predicted membrane protein
MIVFLRTARGRWRSLSLFSLILFIFEQLHLYLLWCLVFMIFLFFFILLAKCFFCILHVYLGVLYVLMISRLLVKKKNKKNEEGMLSATMSYKRMESLLTQCVPYT